MYTAYNTYIHIHILTWFFSAHYFFKCICCSVTELKFENKKIVYPKFFNLYWVLTCWISSFCKLLFFNTNCTRIEMFTLHFSVKRYLMKSRYEKCSSLITNLLTPIKLLSKELNSTEGMALIFAIGFCDINIWSSCAQGNFPDDKLSGLHIIDSAAFLEKHEHFRNQLSSLLRSF